MSEEMYNVPLTNSEIVFLSGQLYMRELDFKQALEKCMEKEDYDSVVDYTAFIKKIKSLQMKIDDARMIANIGGTSID